MGTTLSDIIVPELFNPYVIQKTLEKSALVQSGIVQNDAEFDKLASQASPLVNMPFCKLIKSFIWYGNNSYIRVYCTEWIIG